MDWEVTTHTKVLGIRQRKGSSAYVYTFTTPSDPHDDDTEEEISALADTLSRLPDVVQVKVERTVRYVGTTRKLVKEDSAEEVKEVSLAKYKAAHR